MARWRLEVCDECGTAPCECHLNHLGPVRSITDIEHFDNQRFDPRPPQEPSAEELIAEYRSKQLAGV